MKTLIITAHPSSKGVTHRIATAYKAGVESAGGQAEIIDLYKTDMKQGFLAYEEKHDHFDDPSRDYFQAKIKEADDLVFVHPMWWGTMPAIMKNFVDNNISAGFAFKYVDGRPVGLLRGKTASAYVTADGSIWLYRLLGTPFKKLWKYIIFGLCGLSVRRVALLDKRFLRSEQEIVDFLKGVEQDGKSVVKK